MFRLLLVFLVFGLIDLYVYQGLKQLWSHKLVFNLVYLAFSLAFYVWMILAINDVTDSWDQEFAWYTYFRAFLFILIFAKILALIPLFADDVRRGISYLIQLFTKSRSEVVFADRNRFLIQSALVLAGIPLFLLTYGMIRNPFRFKRRSLSVPIRKLPKDLEGLKIVQISDLHSGTFKNGSFFAEAIEIINREQADLVFFTGDLVNNVADEADSFLEYFSNIQSKYGVFSILGNHDYGDYVQWASKEKKDENFRKLCAQHQKMGWQLLLNEHETLNINGHNINIIGVENYSALPQFPKYGDLEKAKSGAPQAGLNILLSHDPTHWDSKVAGKQKDIHLTLSGHTHGFQFGIEIPGFINWSPSQWVYKRWAGLYAENNQYLYVNRGLGCLAYPGRVGILPEVTVLKLQSNVS